MVGGLSHIYIYIYDICIYRVYIYMCICVYRVSKVTRPLATIRFKPAVAAVGLSMSVGNIVANICANEPTTRLLQTDPNHNDDNHNDKVSRQWTSKSWALFPVDPQREQRN